MPELVQFRGDRANAKRSGDRVSTHLHPRRMGAGTSRLHREREGVKVWRAHLPWPPQQWVGQDQGGNRAVVEPDGDGAVGRDINL